MPAAARGVAGPLRLDGLGGQVLGLQLVHRPPEVEVVITLGLDLAILQVWKHGHYDDLDRRTEKILPTEISKMLTPNLFSI